MALYIALIRKEKKSDFGVNFPDFPGCITAGKTLEEAQEMAEEALEFHIQGMLEDGEDIPAPSALDDIMADSEHKDGVAVLVPVPDLAGKTERINITMPSNVLIKLDRYVDKTPNTNRSQVLTQAVQKYMGSRPSQRSYAQGATLSRDVKRAGTHVTVTGKHAIRKAGTVVASHSRSKRRGSTKTHGGKHSVSRTRKTHR